MPAYHSSDQFYATMQTLFERLRTQTPNPVDSLLASRLVMRLQFTQPQASITINGRRAPVEIFYGPTSASPSAPRPELDVQMSTDILHQILLDQLSLKKAVANRQLKVIGPIWKTTPLAEILEQGRQLYPSILHERGVRPS